MQRIRRTIIIVLATSVVLLVLASLALRVPAVAGVVAELPIGPGLDPTPMPPTIAAPAGALPAGLAGLTELAQYGGQSDQRVGSGFFLRLPNAQVIGVTTAHSVAALGQPGGNLQGMAFAMPGTADHVADFSDLVGGPGMPFSGADLSIDFVLLQIDRPTDAGLVQAPDPRGGPQPGERMALYSGLGGEAGSARVLQGTVMSSTPTAAWLLMDSNFDPGGMSGSPVLSAYTGRVVGMAVAATHKRGRVLIGLNPIGAIVAHGLAAKDYPAIAGYTR